MVSRLSGPPGDLPGEDLVHGDLANPGLVMMGKAYPHGPHEPDDRNEFRTPSFRFASRLSSTSRTQAPSTMLVAPTLIRPPGFPVSILLTPSKRESRPLSDQIMTAEGKRHFQSGRSPANGTCDWASRAPGPRASICSGTGGGDRRGRGRHGGRRWHRRGCRRYGRRRGGGGGGGWLMENCRRGSGGGRFGGRLGPRMDDYECDHHCSDGDDDGNDDNGATADWRLLLLVLVL